MPFDHNPSLIKPPYLSQAEMSNDVADCPYPVIRGRSLSQQVSGSLLPPTGQNRFSWKDWEKAGK